MTRRRLLAGIVAAGSAAVLAASCSAAAPATSPPGGTPASLIGPTVLPTAVASPVPGKWLIVENGNLYVFDLGTMKAQPATQFPKGAYAASPSLSHDRKRVAFTYYVVPKDTKDLGGSDLYLADASGANSQLVSAHPEPGATFEDPCWTADGQAILATLRKPIYDRQNKYQGESLAIFRVGLANSPPVQLLKDALGPATSPDGKYLAYTVVDAKGQPGGLFIADPSGSGGRQILADQGFVYLRAPAFTPDSSRLCFAAVGGPGGALPGKRYGWIPSLAGVAEAHGIPWDIWSVRPDGAELQRLTFESEDTPTPVWSPDGQWVAFAGEIGLYLVDAGGKKTIRISETVSGGGIAWLS